MPAPCRDPATHVGPLVPAVTAEASRGRITTSTLVAVTATCREPVSRSGHASRVLRRKGRVVRGWWTDRDRRAACGLWGRHGFARPDQGSVHSSAVACLSGLKSAPRKRVRGNPPRVQIPPPPPGDVFGHREPANPGQGFAGSCLCGAVVEPRGIRPDYGVGADTRSSADAVGARKCVATPLSRGPRTRQSWQCPPTTRLKGEPL